MTRLVFVTQNHHKLTEIRDLFASTQRYFPHLNRYQLLSLKDIGYLEDIPETMDTLEGNASLKAWTVYRIAGIPCFADDTGLEVKALGNRPGVISARYAGEEKNFDKNMDKVLRELEGSLNRRARFRTVISLIIDRKEAQFEGVAQGTIITEKRGTEGFGYDPIFLPDGFNQTFAEMNLEQKNQVSHRYRAFRKLMDYLNASSMAMV
ncbi:MAG: RdgB/HAM1 family non-canonical purine NTP pyrophosphatase [Bacteroidales bacterium]|nr:RdgB/HAM1 family non-canonical purine NTP pyrophosphatase [Bacteroidales bacterium]